MKISWYSPLSLPFSSRRRGRDLRGWGQSPERTLPAGCRWASSCGWALSRIRILQHTDAPFSDARVNSEEQARFVDAPFSDAWLNSEEQARFVDAPFSDARVNSEEQARFVDAPFSDARVNSEQAVL